MEKLCARLRRKAEAVCGASRQSCPGSPAQADGLTSSQVGEASDLASPLQSSLELKTGTQKGQVWSILCIFNPAVWKTNTGIWWELRHAWDLRERANGADRSVQGKCKLPLLATEKQGAIHEVCGLMAGGPMDDRRETLRNPAARSSDVDAAPENGEVL